MVKGISRQVIVVQSTDKQLFDQAIFILRDDAVGKHAVTDDALLREANRLLVSKKHSRKPVTGPVWALGGALITGLAWFLSALL